MKGLFIFMAQKILILVILLLSACSSQRKADIDTSHIGEVKKDDYVDHLASLGTTYLSSEDVNTVKLRPESLYYLEAVYERLVSNNQVLLTNAEEKPKFFFIKHKSPFLFSLPKGQFYFSTALLDRYLKSEALFIAAFAGEVLKSSRYIYEKRVMIPVGVMSTEKMIQITRLKPETRYQINEWVYYLLKRSGYDASAYLNWIQVQNRNTLDFSLFIGDALGISKEEHLFKNFMTKQGISGTERRLNEANSSKEFYKLINNVVSRE